LISHAAWLENVCDSHIGLLLQLVLLFVSSGAYALPINWDGGHSRVGVIVEGFSDFEPPNRSSHLVTANGTIDLISVVLSCEAGNIAKDGAKVHPTRTRLTEVTERMWPTGGPTALMYQVHLAEQSTCYVLF